MKSIKRIFWELGLEKKFIELKERFKPVAHRLLSLRLGFYSGVIWGMIFSSFLVSLVLWSLIPDGYQYALVTDSMNTVLGWGCAFIMIISFVSHAVRGFLGWPRGCSRYRGSE
jgi:hypothetical protein